MFVGNKEDVYGRTKADCAIHHTGIWSIYKKSVRASHSYKAYNFISEMILYVFRGDKPCRFIQKCQGIWQLNIDNRIEGTQDVRICGAARKIRQDMPALFETG
jgi:hypothetical protein